MSVEWLQGKVAVVTGASRGIGEATAIRLAEKGAHVVASSRDSGALEVVAGTIRSRGGNATAVGCDLGDPAAITALFEAAGQIGPPEVLICAGARLSKGAFDEVEPKDWQRTLDVNLTGTFLCCQEAFRSMRQHGGGRIVTISSLSGVYATEKFPGLTAYNVSKFGVIGLTEALAVEGRPHGISALCISPGAVDTQMLRDANPDLRPGLGPDDVARLIVALLDEDVAPTSGANIPLFSNL